MNLFGMADLIYKRVTRRSSEGHSQEVLKGTANAFLLKIISTALLFIFNVVIARMLGVEGAGIYFLAFTLVTVVGVVARIGLDNAVVKNVAVNASLNEWGIVKAVYAKSMLIGGAASLLLTILTIFAADWAAKKLFEKPSLVVPLQVMALSIFPCALYTLHSCALQGLKRIKDATLVLNTLTPFFCILLIAPAVYYANMNGAALAYVVSSIITLVVGYRRWKKCVYGASNVKVDYSIAGLLGTSIPMFVASMLQLILTWGSVILIGVWCDSSTVGVFNSVIRTSNLMAFFLVAINSIVAPKFAELYQSKDFASLKKIARLSTVLSIFFALPLFLIFIIYPQYVLQVFGNEFISGSDALRIAIVGQFISVITGSVGYLLNMSGHEKVVRNIMFFAALLNVVLNLLLIPKYGIIGAAMAHAGTIGLQNIVAAIMVKRYFGFWLIGKLGC